LNWKLQLLQNPKYIYRTQWHVPTQDIRIFRYYVFLGYNKTGNLYFRGKEGIKPKN